MVLVQVINARDEHLLDLLSNETFVVIPGDSPGELLLSTSNGQVIRVFLDSHLITGIPALQLEKFRLESERTKLNG